MLTLLSIVCVLFFTSYATSQEYDATVPMYSSRLHYFGGYQNRHVGHHDARLGYSVSKGHPSVSYHYEYQPSYGYKEQHQQQSGYGHQQHGHQQQSGYGHQQQSGYGHDDHSGGYEHKEPSYGHQPSHGYQQQQTYEPPKYYEVKKEKIKIKKVYVPIVVKKKKKKKMKVISEYKGFFIEGGTQLFGKFKDVKSCKKACAITPTCFAGDYNPWLKKCYLHTNLTACENMKGHKSIWHFKKIPCQLVETPLGLITPGAQIFNAIEQKGIKSLSDCIKKCATAGGGIAPSPTTIATTPQLCFGIDYDFATHKCYFHIDPIVCPATDPIPTPVNLVANPTVVNIIMCPLTTG